MPCAWPARRASCAALLCLLLLACGGEPGAPAAAPDTQVALQPGETLLDHGASFQVVEYPATQLPPDVAVQGAVRATTGRLVVQADEWVEGEVVPAPFRLSLALSEDARVFRATPQVGFRPTDEEPQLSHDGRHLQPWRQPGSNHLWRDENAELIFWWDTANATLTAIGRWSPGETQLLQGGGEEQVALKGDAPVAAAPSAAVSASALRQRLTVGCSSRPGLLVPAPSELRLDLAGLTGNSLELVVAATERVYRRDDSGRVLQKLWAELPLRFLLEAEVAGERRPLWSRSLTAAEGFVRERVDLSALPDGPLALFLRTEPGQPTEGSWPYGFWGDLALTGPRGPSARPSGPARPHVVIIDVDTWRADRLSVYGYARETTPRLADWAARSATVYRDVMSASNWTLPSTASMLTGLAVHQHGLLRFPRVLSPQTPTLATLLRRAGYQTWAMVEGGYVSAAFGFDQGFDRFDQVPFQEPHWDEVLGWLEQRTDERPVFLFLQTYFVHAPWKADDRFLDAQRPYTGQLAGRDVTHERVIKPYEAGRLALDEADQAYVSALYDAAVARLDAYLGDFITRLDGLLPPGERLLVITSDHGEELFTRGRIEHGSTLFQELLAVPLLVQYPEPPWGTVDDQSASSLDLLPTVLETVGLTPPAGLPGRSLRAERQLNRARFSQHAEAAHAVQFEGWKLVVGPVRGNAPDGALDELQLYDLHADPGELQDIAAAVPEWVRRLRGMLDEFNLAHRPPEGIAREEEIDAGVVSDLQQMGYLGEH